jgi:hypothetical protein
MGGLLDLLPKGMPQGSVPAWLTFILLTLAVTARVLVPMIQTSADRHRALNRLREMERVQSHDSHLARWTKDGGKRILWLNAKAYLSIFAPLGVGRDEVEGKTFAELLSEDAAMEVARLDEMALAHPEMAASNMIRLHPSLPVMWIVKIAATGLDGALMFEGYAYRTNDRMLSDGIGLERHRVQVARSAESLLPNS